MDNKTLSNIADAQMITEFNFQKPHQPDVSVIPPQQLKQRTVFFQQYWFNKYPWLLYDTKTKGVYFALALPRHLLSTFSESPNILNQTSYKMTLEIGKKEVEIMDVSKNIRLLTAIL